MNVNETLMQISHTYMYIQRRRTITTTTKTNELVYFFRIPTEHIMLFLHLYVAQFYVLSPVQGVLKRNTHTNKKTVDDVQVPPPKNILLLRSFEQSCGRRQ